MELIHTGFTVLCDEIAVTVQPLGEPWEGGRLQATSMTSAVPADEGKQEVESSYSATCPQKMLPNVLNPMECILAS